MTSEKVRVAVLGGGIAGLTTAHELTRTPELRARHDVTVYQYGWRLGGKCASGRDLDRRPHPRARAPHVVRPVRERLRLDARLLRRAGPAPGRTPRDDRRRVPAPQRRVLWDDYGDRWSSVNLFFPPNDQVPGDGTPIPDFWEMAWRAATSSWDEWRSRRHGGRPVHQIHLPNWARAVADDIGAVVDAAVHAPEEAMLFLARELARFHVTNPRRPDEADHRHVLRRLFTDFRSWVWRHAIEPHLDDDGLRFWFTRLDISLTLMIGVVADEVHERGFDPLNGLELRDWLRSHGAQEITLAGPFVRASYSGAFAFLDGDVNQPNLAAGVGLLWTLRQMLGYKGALSFRMMAGMGDAVVAPIYQVLLRRGVRFRFFHRVTELAPSSDGTRVGAVHLVRQARPVGPEYQPLVDVDGLACWPATPRWDQLEDGAALAAAGVDFEDDDGPAPEALRLEARRRLRPGRPRGVGRRPSRPCAPGCSPTSAGPVSPPCSPTPPP